MKHGKSQDQGQHGQKKRKSSEVSENLHLFSPPFLAFGFDFAL
jgi:hypothetical protein